MTLMSLLRRPARQVRRRRSGVAGGAEAGFALIYSVLLITVVMSLSVAVLALMLNQIKPTQFARKSTQTLNNAEGGFDAALNRLRTSTDASGAGLLPALPQCASGSDHATVNGNVTTAAGNTYAVDIYYLTTDPLGLTLAQVKAAAMSCSPLAAVPKFAYLRSYGKAPQLAGRAAVTGNRTLHAIYQFKSTNGQVVGGRIKEYTQQVCWDIGGSGFAAAGTPVVLKTCLATGAPTQSWIYRGDLTIFYGGDPSLNLCVQQATSSTALVLAACASVTTKSDGTTIPAGTGATYDTTRYSSTGGYPPGLQAQEWSFDDNGHFEGAAAGGGLNNQCITTSSATPVTGDPLLQGGCSGGTDSYQAFNPDPTAGAGAASGTTTGLPGNNGQLTNYQEFGRCLDVTGQQPDAAYLIDYPCKQAPDPTQVRWNQRFAFTLSNPDPADKRTGTLSTESPNGRYCLTAGATVNDPIHYTRCVGTNSLIGRDNTSAFQKWTFMQTVYYPDGVTVDYDNSYSIRSTANNATPGGLCMSLRTGPVDTNIQGSGSFDTVWSTVFLETCNGTDREKWNAPPGQPQTRLSGVGEEQDH